MAVRALGSSGLDVSVLSVGSWQTFEHLPRETGIEILATARDAGIDFFDDARYDDRTGAAPMATGYSEVVFGEIFRGAGLRREDAVVANKLWWEFWPEQSAAQELEASLGRMGFDYVDLIYANSPPDGLSVPEMVRAIAELVSSGKARSWGIVNWPAARIAEAVGVAAREAAPAPCAAQLPYSLVRRSPVEDADMVGVLRAAGIPVVASFVLAGGALTGKYRSDKHRSDKHRSADSRPAEASGGRVAATLDDPSLQPALSAGDQLRRLAGEAGTTPAALAIAYTLSNPDVASVLFGATSPAQVLQNAAAPDLLSSMDADLLAKLRRIGP